MVNHVKSPPIPQKMSLPTHLPGTFQTSPSGRHCWDASARPPGAIKLPFGDGWNMLEYPRIKIVILGMVYSWVYHICHPDPRTLHYNTIQYPFIILCKGNEMSTSSGQILSNKHPQVMRETSRSSRQSDHSLAAVHSRGGDATSRWFLHVGWLITLRP